MAVHPNSLANLGKPYGFGENHNPAGRPSAGLALIEYLNELVIEDEKGLPRYSLDVLKRFSKDEKGSHTKAMAAEMIILARSRGFDALGKPMAAKLIDMICDRTRGKPLQSVEVTRQPTYSAQELLAASATMLAQSPQLRALIDAQGVIEAEAIALPPGDDDEDSEDSE